jgi:hydroxyacylglutathione hydrolase
VKIKKHIVGPMQVNCYVAWDEASGEAMVIDPGGGAKKIARTIKDKGLKLKAIVHTHGHWDHTAGSNALQKLTGAPLFRRSEDPKSGMLHRPRKADGLKVVDIGDGEKLMLGAMEVEFIHTPGHSRGSMVIYAAPVLFSGDLLFKDSVGRWDLAGGSFRELVNSLNKRLTHVPDDTDVLPGHGPATTLGQERRNNQFFKSARQLKKNGGRKH